MLKKKVRKVLHIVQNKKDKDKPWKIKSENQKESFGSFRTQKQAIVEAKKNCLQTRTKSSKTSRKKWEDSS